VSSTEAQTALGAFRPLLQVIADSCRQGGPPLRERLLAGRTDALATFEPGLRELPGAGTEPLAEPEAPPSTGEAARFRLFEAMLETLRAFAQAGTPLVLIIDDLQWLDDLSQAFIERLDRTFLEQNAILLLGSYRSDEVQPGVRTHLAQLGWSQELARLGREEIGRMVGDMLAVPSSTPELVDTLARLSNGNPYFVTEYVRMAVEGGWLAREPGSPWLLTAGGQQALDRAERLPTPTSLAAVLAERLRYLSEPTRELARFAAVLGNRFTLEELQRGLGPPASGVLESVSDMLRGQMLASARDHSLEFVHERLRQAALASVPPAALPGLHRTAALTLESGANAGDRLGDLAHHWHQAGDPAKEREYRGPAGERAFRVGAYADAIAHLERALALRSPEEDPAETVRLQRHLAEAYFGAGDMVASRRWIEALATRAGLPLPVGRWATGLTAVGDIAGALARHALRPLLHSRSPARRRLLADVAGAFERLAHVMFFENELVGVTASSLRALGAASRLGPSPELARVYANLSISAALIPLHDVARGLAAEARQIALDINDAPALTWTRQLDGVYLAGLGEFADARASFEQALASWQTIGDRRRWEETLTLLGMCLFHAGELSEAARIRHQLERAGRDSGNRQTVGWALIGNAEDLLVRGEVDGAVGVLEQARTLGPFVRRVEQVWMHAMLARACHLRGEYDRAHQAAEEARQRLARSIPTAFYVLEGYSALAEVYRALADRSTGPERRQLERHARGASRALAGFTRVFPFSQGRRRLSRGMQLVARGKLADARGLWAEAAGQATRDRRVLDAALLWRALAQHPAAPDQVDSEAQRQAATWMAHALR
jgi:eukaryotic-like serine/threonine-protein kinase